MNMDKILLECVEQIWNEYDKDKSGYLDKAECKDFIMSTVDEMEGIPMPSAEGDGPEEEFEKCFSEVDRDGNGKISKEEMLGFIKRVANI